MKRHDRWRGLTALGLTAIAVLLAAFWIWHRTQPAERSAPLPVPAPVPRVAPTEASNDIDSDDRKALEDVLRRKGAKR